MPKVSSAFPSLLLSLPTFDKTGPIAELLYEILTGGAGLWPLEGSGCSTSPSFAAVMVTLRAMPGIVDSIYIYPSARRGTYGNRFRVQHDR